MTEQASAVVAFLVRLVLRSMLHLAKSVLDSSQFLLSDTPKSRSSFVYVRLKSFQSLFIIGCAGDVTLFSKPRELSVSFVVSYESGNRYVFKYVRRWMKDDISACRCLSGRGVKKCSNKECLAVTLT